MAMMNGGVFLFCLEGRDLNCSGVTRRNFHKFSYEGSPALVFAVSAIGFRRLFGFQF